jgi:hypothetical protein
MKFSMIFFLCLIVLCNFSCREKGIEPRTVDIQLTAEDVGVTEVYLRIKATMGPGPWTLTLKRDGQIIFNSQQSNFISFDTLILDEQRLPKHNYTYKVLYTINGTAVDSSAPLFVTTMDTTSHAFTWEVITLGDGFSHGFNDVAIINDTCVWAIGEILKLDSTRQWVSYNAVRWDGKEWHLMRVMYNYQGRGYYSALYSVFAFGENDYWVGSNQPMHWNGSKWETYDLPATIWNGWIYKMWGTSSQSIYIVGVGGNIAHYNGSSWQKLESGTTLDITDIWGSTNNKTGVQEIMAVACKPYQAYERTILKIAGTTAITISDSGIGNRTSLMGIWFVPGRKYYVSGGSIFSKRSPFDSEPWFEEQSTFYAFYYHAIRGNELNDIVAVCDGGEILHFNGYTWKSYLRETILEYGHYNSVASRGNMIVAVGDNYGCGVIAIGRR